jgi:hypothetical protein
MADQPSNDDRFHHIEYIHFMIGQLNETIKYSDSKHAVGLTLVVSLLLTGNEFIFRKVDRTQDLVLFLLNFNVSTAFIAVLFGFLGIFPKFIAPLFLKEKSIKDPNIFYFRDINASDTLSLQRTLDKTFPHSNLSEAYRRSGIMEIHALSSIAMRKMKMFEYFMYALSGFLVSLLWLFSTTIGRK